MFKMNGYLSLNNEREPKQYDCLAIILLSFLCLSVPLYIVFMCVFNYTLVSTFDNTYFIQFVLSTSLFVILLNPNLFFLSVLFMFGLSINSINMFTGNLKSLLTNPSFMLAGDYVFYWLQVGNLLSSCLLLFSTWIYFKRYTTLLSMFVFTFIVANSICVTWSEYIIQYEFITFPYFSYMSVYFYGTVACYYLLLLVFIIIVVVNYFYPVPRSRDLLCILTLFSLFILSILQSLRINRYLTPMSDK